MTLQKTKRAPASRDPHPSQGGVAAGKGNSIPCEKDVKIMFDISKLAVSPTSIIELESPDGELLLNDAGESITITVYGPGSKQYQKAQAIRNRAVLDYIRKGSKKMKDDEQRELDAEFLSACTCAFNGFVYKELTGIEMFKAVYMDAAIGFIGEQVNKAIGDWSNFTKGSQKT